MKDLAAGPKQKSIIQRKEKNSVVVAFWSRAFFKGTRLVSDQRVGSSPGHCIRVIEQDFAIIDSSFRMGH